MTIISELDVGVGGGGPNGVDQKSERSYKFGFLPESVPKCFGNRQLQADFIKWGLGQDMVIIRFLYDSPANSEDEARFMVNQFFASSEAQRILPHACAGVGSLGSQAKVELDPVSISQTDMSIFHVLTEKRIVNPSTGRIQGRLEEDWEGIPLYDTLREALVCEDSELYEVFSKKARNEWVSLPVPFHATTSTVFLAAMRRELLFKVFWHVVIGGASNQYDEVITPYIEHTKQIFKDLVSVRLAPDGSIICPCRAYRVTGVSGTKLHSNDHPSNYCYVIVDPTMRHLTVWYYQYRPFW
ncbi:hypothetical protein FOL47_008287 [Perkinsus chesapeaki]|uniref:Cilia- and flagella-associated protein 300 n=1 Tax=Perkinsus chesapeaki TaxID=330153 RepID=A0A7J6LF30_PERCH|nr:hypothetical protein FOL47_008287 [Perkinsus chesapeaki]